MAITISKARWQASARHLRKDTRERLSTDQRIAINDALAKLVPGGVGKGKKHRYLSDFTFPTEAKAHAFWDKHLVGDLIHLVDISAIYRMYF